MVARDDMGGDAGPPLGARVAALFLAWRRWLTHLLTALRRLTPAVRAGLRRLAAFPALVWRFVLHPAEAASSEGERRALAATGLASLAAGSVLSVALAHALRVPLPEAVVSVVWTLGWAGLRLGILRVATRRTPASEVRLAWAAGLLPAVAGLTDPLRLLTLALSAWLTHGSLRRAGSRPAEAHSAVAWAFGAEMVAAVVRWVGAGLLLYFVATR